MAQTLTEERKVAWRIQGIGPDPAHSLVIFKKVGQGKILHKVLRPGEVFKRPLLTSADSYEAYAVSADNNLRHEFSRKYQAGAQTWTFTLHFKLHFRVESVERLGLSLSGQDPLERLQEEVASMLSATARRFSWEIMKREGEDFGLRLREAEATDGQGERRTNFHRLQSFAGDLGLELRHLDVLRSLTEPDLADEKKVRVNEQQKVIARSDQGLAAEREQLNHELQSLRDQHGIERETAMARSSQALQGMERLRQVLDAVAEGGAQAIHQSAGELRSFDAIHRALIEVQGIQASLAGLAGGAAPALEPAAHGKAIAGIASGGVLQLTARQGSPLESAVAEAFRHLRILDENPRDQRRILASVLHLIAEAGLGTEADENFLIGMREDLEGRLYPVKGAIPEEPRDFLESILDLEGLRQRLS
ncbi:MAG: hypothetical protein QOE95_1860 [Gaiellaceae bacterium]|nr:hypothetical protein [Gaiellaceae bacterium]